LPEHFVVPGTHTPLQEPLVQPYWQATTAPQPPVLLHVSTPSPVPPSPAAAQLLLPGAHTPEHEAEALVAAMHAWFPQSTG
jgi:hypothetical protein